jgi:adenylate cyclase
VAADDEEQARPDAAIDGAVEALLHGLVGDARHDRSELIAWLLDRGFTTDQIGASLTPMMLPASRVMGDDGAYVSAREMSRLSGIELGLLQRLMRAAGLPRIEDPDAAVVARVDAEAVQTQNTFSTSGWSQPRRSRS